MISAPTYYVITQYIIIVYVLYTLIIIAAVVDRNLYGQPIKWPFDFIPNSVPLAGRCTRVQQIGYGHTAVGIGTVLMYIMIILIYVVRSPVRDRSLHRYSILTRRAHSALSSESSRK